MATLLAYLLSITWLTIATYAGLRLLVTIAGVWLAGGLVTWLAAPSAMILLLFWIPVALCSLLLGIPAIRARVVSERIRGWFRTVLPPVSETEREAIEAGSVWFDRQLFTGAPDFSILDKLPDPHLSDEEQAFVDGPTAELCGMLNEWDVEQRGDLPPEVWAFIKEHRFMAMIIDKKYGGLGFSNQANSAVVLKLSSRSMTAATTVMVPNSLGPGELLGHFGTEEQRDHYLPRLARSEDIPCFALTGPYAGSDAAAMNDVGVLCKQEFEGRETLGFRVNFEKRYITLAPVATVVGLAFKARDPDGLLGSTKELGITCALLPRQTPGIKIGDRHRPIGGPFLNGPIEGKDVFVPLEWVIGGRERIGQGWRMLMFCLAAGRAISLPALGVAGSKYAAATAGAYARVRKQFKIPIGKFEGIREQLTPLAGNTYRMDATRLLTNSALDEGEKPPVISAILKHYLTEGNRESLIRAMDIHGGKTVIEGHSNYLAPFYKSMPVAITVEGANILTRTLIVFGQGAIRCHPFILREMEAAADQDQISARREFDQALFAHIGFSIRNVLRAFVLGLSKSKLARTPAQGEHTLGYGYQHLTRLSADFAVLTDFVMLLMGGKLKLAERLTGRYADVLAHLYMATSVLWRFERDGRQQADVAVARWALHDSFHRIQTQMDQILANFPNQLVASLLRGVIFPLGRDLKAPSDVHSEQVAEVLLSINSTRERLLSGIHLDTSSDHPADLPERALIAALESAETEQILQKAFRVSIAPHNVDELTERGVNQGIISTEQAEKLRQAQQLAFALITVDSYQPEQIEAQQFTTLRKAS